MKYNYLIKNNKKLKIGVYTTYFPNLDPRFITYQKKVFDKFGIEINQIKNLPNLLGRGYNSHGTFLTEMSKNEDVDYLIFFDVDAIPLHPDFLNIVIDRVYNKNVILGIEQNSNRDANAPEYPKYAGPACFVISKETYNLLGQPNYNETLRSDVAEELTHLCREKGIEIDMFVFESCKLPQWPLRDGRMFGHASLYEGLVFHNFECRNSEQIVWFIDKCKEVLDEYDLQILIHILPYEIDQLEQLLIQLKHGSRYLETNRILVDVVLNNNLTNWDKSSLPKSFFITKFNQLESLTKTWAKTKFEVNEDQTILGCVDHRKKAIKETQSKALFTIDTDIIISPTLLFYLVTAINTIDNQYYILTPQITPIWDDSWKVLVNENYINESSGDSFKTRDPYKHTQNLGEVNIKPIDTIKFGGGLATVISTSLVKHIGIPESFSPYGLEDTFIMTCAQIMKQNNEDVTQFILENEVVVEDQLFRFNPYKDYLVNVDKREEFKQISNDIFSEEVSKFINKLNK
jgi:hypothetical protein